MQASGHDRTLPWPLALHAHFSKPWWMHGGPSSDPEPDPEFAVLPQHLLERLSVRQIEVRGQVDDPQHAVPPLPFGHLKAPWRQLLKRLTEGDEFWSFEAPRGLPWGTREERHGYAPVRAGAAAAWRLRLIQAIPDETPLRASLTSVKSCVASRIQVRVRSNFS